jgi:hypothetical protein
MAAPSCVLFEDTRATESTKGCDFELWIGSTSSCWRRYAVQAKKIDFPSGRYASLAHKVGGTPQIDILDEYAKANLAFPIYCFYNNSAKPFSWNCSLPKHSEQLGCSVTPSSVVRAALSKRGGKDFESIHKSAATIPWRCLVRCPAFINASVVRHNGWESLEGATHKQLPSALRRLQENPSQTPFTADSADLFSAQVELRPGWVGIIDVSAAQ